MTTTMTNKISVRNSKFAKIGLQDLCDYIKDNIKIRPEDFEMIEIGSYVGDSTKIFAENFGRVISIDPYENGYDDKDASSFTYPMKQIYDQFHEEVLLKYKNVVHMPLKSLQAVSLFGDQSMHMVYVDGNHRGFAVHDDLEAWIPKVKLGYYIAGHDYNNRKHAPEVKDAVDQFFTIDMSFRDTSWIKRLI